MNDNGLKRKFDIDKYVEKINQLRWIIWNVYGNIETLPPYILISLLVKID